MFTLKEIIKWFGITVFEMLLLSISILAYSVLITFKLEGYFTGLNWWIVHSPLFMCDAFISYFCTIVFIRQYLEGSYKIAIFRGLWSFNQILLLFLGKLLLCFKLEGQRHITHSEVCSPIFFLLILLIIRACQLH